MTRESGPSEPPVEAPVPEGRAAEPKKTVQGFRKETRESLHPRNDAEAFDLSSAADNRMVRNYEPKFLAKGGEHIVYGIPGRDDIVVKVEARIMRRWQEHNAASDRPLDALDPELLPGIEAGLAEQRKRFATLRERFGREHVPNVKQFVAKLPVTPALISRLHGGHPPQGWKDAKESWSLVRVQPRVPEVGAAGSASVTAGYLEKRQREPETSYQRVTQAYLEGRPPEKFSPEEFDVIHPDLSAMMHYAASEGNDAETVRDFVRKSISYARDTGEILDLAGDDNVVFFKKDGKLEYKLVDALYPGDHDMLRLAEPIMRKIAAGTELDPDERGRLMNIVNFVRTINALAERSGVEDRLDVVPDDIKGKIDFYAAITR